MDIKAAPIKKKDPLGGKRSAVIKPHKFKAPKASTVAALQKATRIPSHIEGMDKIVGPGYPRGALINVVGFPKAGKTTFLIHESMYMSQKGKDVLFMYNEEPRDDTLANFDQHRRDLNLPVSALDHITLLDAHGKAMRSAQYKDMDAKATLWVKHPVQVLMENGLKPEIIIIDSMTRFYRTFPAQSFQFVATASYGLKTLFRKFNVRPVVFIVHQKASTGPGAGKDDERGFGGWGNIHEMDGSIVIKRQHIGYWEWKNMGFPIGTYQHFITGSFRHIRSPQLDYQLNQQLTAPMNLSVGEPLMDLVDEWQTKLAMEQAELRGGAQ